MPTALMASLINSTLSASASGLGLIEAYLTTLPSQAGSSAVRWSTNPVATAVSRLATTPSPLCCLR